MNTEIDRVSEHAVIWHRYDPAVKAELFSTALQTECGLVFIDPISVDASQLDELTGAETVAAVVITNANHHRAAPEFARKFSATLYAHADSEIDATRIEEGDLIAPNFEAIAIEGAAPGELSLLDKRSGGTLVMGDALINFGSSGFAFLPAKYCENQKRMRKSLRQLLDYQFERILFAHGAPIVTKAHARLAALLESA